jgi:DNA-binding GntR family transcriptional regulator
MKQMTLRIKETDIKALSDLAYQKIKDAIISGRFAPNDRISERKLADEMGISTSPVKQALNRLRYEGLIEIKPRKGTYVAPFCFAALEEISWIRAYMEGLAARFAAMKAVEADVLKIQQQLQLMEELSAKGNSEKLVKANTEFHALLHRISRNQYITQLVEIVRSFDLSVRKKALACEDEVKRGLAEHRSIGEAIIERDPGLAEERMKQHIVRTARFVLNEGEKE